MPKQLAVRSTLKEMKRILPLINLETMRGWVKDKAQFVIAKHVKHLGNGFYVITTEDGKFLRIHASELIPTQLFAEEINVVVNKVYLWGKIKKKKVVTIPKTVLGFFRIELREKYPYIDVCIAVEQLTQK